MIGLQEDRMRKFRDDMEESSRRQKKLLEETAEVTLVNVKASLMRNEDAMREEGQRKLDQTKADFDTKQRVRQMGQGGHLTRPCPAR